jgi:hypothetical protein
VTFNWDYQCSASDKNLALEVAATFTAGSAGPFRLTDIAASVKPTGEPVGDPAFTRDDVEQFWTADDAFLIAFSRYVGEESDPARLMVTTTCKVRACKGTYAYTCRGANAGGIINCQQSEAG